MEYKQRYFAPEEWYKVCDKLKTNGTQKIQQQKKLSFYTQKKETCTKGNK